MRQVFSNIQCAHVWAQQEQHSGRGSKGSIYFDGATIYSYGSHFPIATFVKPNVVLYNGDSYSNSTSGHQSDVRRALSDTVEMIVTDTRRIRDVVVRYSRTAAYEAIVADKLINLANKAIELANPRKRAYQVEGWDGALDETGQARADTIDGSDVQRTARLLDVTLIDADVVATVEKARKLILDAFAAHFAPEAVAKRAKAKAKRDKVAPLANARKWFDKVRTTHVRWQDRSRFDECMARLNSSDAAHAALIREVQTHYADRETDDAFAVANPDAASILWRRKYRDNDKRLTADDWQAGANGAFYQATPCLVRRKGSMLQTSQGAEAPFKHAVAIFAKAQQCKADQVGWVRNGHTMHAGHFSLDSIDSFGNIVIGCHRITFDEMLRLAIREVPHLVKPAYPMPVLLAA